MRNLGRFIVIALVAGGLLAGGIIALAIPIASISQHGATSSAAPLADLQDVPSEPSVVYADDGTTVLGYFRDSVNRVPVALKDVAPILIHAVLDTEDARFYTHGAIDIPSTIRALFSNVSAAGVRQGGSDITQQLVKQTYLNSQKKLSRKIKEAVIAVRLERKYTKNQILAAYLNTVYFGNGAYGVQAAANEYFGVNASQVTAPEAALLAGMIQNPSGYNPIVFPVNARVRRNFVLSRMVKEGHLTPAQETAAAASPLPTSINYPKGSPDTKLGYYVAEVEKELLGNGSPLGGSYHARYNELFNGGLKIYTNLDPHMQSVAEQAVANDIPANNRGLTAALVAIDPHTGKVRALVGGPGFDQSQFDLATQAHRNPGSGFKLFTLVGAYESGYGPNDTVDGTAPCAIAFPGPYGRGYLPPNKPALNAADGEGKGIMTVTNATANSINCAFIRIGHEVGLDKIISVAHQLGLSEKFIPAPSIIIGGESVTPLEMANAYATVDDDGVYHAPSFIDHIVTRTGTQLYNGQQPGVRVMSTQVAREVVQTLRAVVGYGTGTAAQIYGRQVAGKTGTTDLSTDAWFNGLTPQLAASVWMGAVNGEVPMYNVGPYYEVFGGDYPTQIFHDFMAGALQGQPSLSFPLPNPSEIPPAKPINSPALQRDTLQLTPPTTVPPPTTAPATTTAPPATTAPAATTVPPATTAAPPTTAVPTTATPTTHAP